MSTRAGPWPSGAWRVLGERALFESAREVLEVLARSPSARGPRPLGDHRAFFKGAHLRVRPALRHALRRAVGLRIPRLQEFTNLEWLAAHGFLAARPLLAGVRVRAWLPRYQFLFTELRPDEPTLEEWWPSATSAQRAALLVTLARDVARLHGLGFVHRDLFPRNLLVTAGPPRCVFLDAWRGGPGPGWRGPDYDLACLFLDGARLFTPTEQAVLLQSYREESQGLGRSISRGWPARVERERAALFRREAGRRSGLVAGWEFPPLP